MSFRENDGSMSGPRGSICSGCSSVGTTNCLACRLCPHQGLLGCPAKTQTITKVLSLTVELVSPGFLLARILLRSPRVIHQSDNLTITMSYRGGEVVQTFSYHEAVTEKVSLAESLRPVSMSEIGKEAMRRFKLELLMAQFGMLFDAVFSDGFPDRSGSMGDDMEDGFPYAETYPSWMNHGGGPFGFNGDSRVGKSAAFGRRHAMEAFEEPWDRTPFSRPLSESTGMSSSLGDAHSLYERPFEMPGMTKLGDDGDGEFMFFFVGDGSGFGPDDRD